MDTHPSIKRIFRARNNERGFALIVALVLAILFFAFIELLMIDASRALWEARQFRSRVVAQTLAENGAEMAALSILTRRATPPDEASDAQGTVSWWMRKTETKFEIEANARSSGPQGMPATVRLEGDATESKIQIEFARHSQ